MYDSRDVVEHFPIDLMRKKILKIDFQYFQKKTANSNNVDFFLNFKESNLKLANLLINF